MTLINDVLPDYEGVESYNDYCKLMRVQPTPELYSAFINKDRQKLRRLTIQQLAEPGTITNPKCSHEELIFNDGARIATCKRCGVIIPYPPDEPEAAEINLTPEVLARWVGQHAPLAEAEKVLQTWLEQVGGIIYIRDSKHKSGWGIFAQDNRPGREGINLKGIGVNGKDWFNTFAQFLEFGLKWAEDTIRADEHVKTYGQTIVEFTDRLALAGVDIDLIQAVITAWRDEKESKLKDA